MSDIQPLVTPAPRPPWKSPTYPQRVHVRERPHWQGILKHWEERIEQARAQLTASGDDLVKSRLFAQMLGARDQIAESARRLPMETGHLYHEDRHRLEEAVAALERLFARWG